MDAKCLKLSRICLKQKEIILPIESKANDMKVELDKIKNLACNKCQSHEFKIVKVNQVLKKYQKGQIGLENVLSRQRYSNAKYGFGWSKFDKPSMSKTIFVKVRNKFNNIESKKVYVVIHPKKVNAKNNSYVSKDDNSFKSTCFYWNTKGHTLNAFYISNLSISNGEYVLVEKRTKPKGPIEYCVS